MAKLQPNQTSFSSGELSPLMLGRSDTPIYKQGLSTLRNMYSDSRGPAVNRESMKWIQDIPLPVGTQNARIDTFNRNNLEFFTFIFVDKLLYFIRNLEFETLSSVAAPWTEDQIDDIYIIPLPDGRTFYLLHPNVQPYRLIDNFGDKISEDILTDSNWIVPAGVTLINLCVAAGGGGGGGGHGHLDHGGAGGGGGGGSGVVKATVAVTPGETLAIVVGPGGAEGIGQTGDPKGGDGGNGIPSSATGSFGQILANGGLGGRGGWAVSNASGEGAGGLGAEGGGLGGQGGNNITGTAGSRAPAEGAITFALCEGSLYVGGQIYSLPVSTSADGGGGGGGGFGAGGHGGQGNATDSIAALPGNLTAGGGGGGGNGNIFNFGFNGGKGGEGKININYASQNVAIDLAPVVFVGEPSEWTGLNWPSCGTYFQNRLWLASTPEEPENFWASKIGAPTDFTAGVDPDVAQGSLNFTMENFGPIQWMVNAKTLLIGTSNGEYLVQSSGGFIAINDINVVQHSSYGSASIQPLKVGDQVIYVTPDRRKLRAINYEERKNNWMSTDLTLPSEHITQGLIKNISWAQHPNNLLWVNLSDGKMACLSYERGDGIYGWHRHDTQGFILSADAGFDSERTVQTLLTIRKSGFVSLEAMSPVNYVDSWKPTTVFTYYERLGVIYYYIEGFDYLDGRSLQVSIDDKYEATRTVGKESIAGAGDGVPGRIYLSNQGGVAVAGLGYRAEMATLPTDNGSVSGSGAGYKKHRNKVYVRLFKSGPPLINNVRDPSLPTDDLITGTLEEVNLGYDREAKVSVAQDLPMRLEVLAIYGEMNRSSL